MHKGRETGLHSEDKNDKWGLIAEMQGGSVDRKLLRRHIKAGGFLLEPIGFLLKAGQGRKIPGVG